MRVFRNLFDFYLQSSLHVGLAVLALLHCSLLQLQINVPLPVSLAVFCGTVLGYNFLKYAELVYLGKAKSTWHWAIGFCTALAAVCFVIALFQLSALQQLVFLSSGLLVLGYPLLRRYGWLKLFFVSASVTYITVFIPLVLKKHFDQELVYLFVQRFFCWAVCSFLLRYGIAPMILCPCIHCPNGWVFPKPKYWATVCWFPFWF